MGIRREATVEESILSTRRRRRHRVVLLKDIEEDLSRMQTTMRNADDIIL